MKKLIVFLIIVQILTGCTSQEQQFLKAENSIIYANLDDTVANYYFEEEDSIVLSLYSFSEEVSPIITLSLQNMLSLHNVNVENYTVDENEYYYSIIKSLYTEKNNINLSQLTEDSNQYDFYLAFKVAHTLKDQQLMSQLTEIYLTYNPNPEDFFNSVFQVINMNYIKNDIEKIDDGVKNTLTNISIDLRFDFYSLMNLNACLNYIQHFNIQMEKDVLNQIKIVLMDKSNQMYILSQPEITVSQYIDSLSILNQLLGDNSSLHETFFAEYIQFDNECYRSFVYDENGIRNFSFYITLLYYSQYEVTQRHYEYLILIVRNMENTVDIGDNQSIYYLHFICNILGIESTVSTLNKKIDTSDEINQIYFDLKNNDTIIDSVEDIPEDILAKLLYLDVCSDDIYIHQEIKDIEILLYIDLEYFPVILNLYVAIMKNNQITNVKIEEEIVTFIESKENVYGYSGQKKNYDLEASSYYTNILNMIEIGEDNGLR